MERAWSSRASRSAEQPADGAPEGRAEQRAHTSAYYNSPKTAIKRSSGSAAQPTDRAADSSAEQPAQEIADDRGKRRKCGDKEKLQHAVADDLPSGDEHPADCTFRPRTPLWDKLVEKLDMAAPTSEGQQLMKFFEEQCFSGDLCYKDSNGDTLKEPMPIALKMEILLTTAAKRRKLILDRLRRSAVQPVLDVSHEIDEKVMKIMYNEWRWDVASWMNEKNLSRYHELRKKWPSEAQQMTKNRFNAYRFHLAGSKFVLHKLIQLPFIAQCISNPSGSAEQPVSLMKCINDLREHMKSDMYKAAVARSQKRASEHIRLSQRIWEASRWLAIGEVLSFRALNGEFWKLQGWEQQLVDHYQTGRLERSLESLLSLRAPIYKGIAASVQSASSSSSAAQPALSSSSAAQPASSST